MTTLKIAIQKSGRLSEKTFTLLENAGFQFEMTDRSLMAKCRNFPLELLFLRTDDIPEIVADGTSDLGICGQNSIAEKGFDLKEIEKLGFGKCRLSIAVPEKLISSFATGGEPFLNGMRIATSYPNILQNYLTEKGISAEIIKLSGSVEIAPNIGTADAICDLVSTGSTLKMNGLVEQEEIFFSESVLVGTGNLSKEKENILQDFLIRIGAVLLAKKFKYIVMNLERKDIPKLTEILPGLKSPTITSLADENWVSVSTVVEEKIFWATIGKLKEIGAEGILVQPIEKLII